MYYFNRLDIDFVRSTANAILYNSVNMWYVHFDWNYVNRLSFTDIVLFGSRCGVDRIHNNCVKTYALYNTKTKELSTIIDDRHDDPNGQVYCSREQCTMAKRQYIISGFHAISCCETFDFATVLSSPMKRVRITLKLYEREKQKTPTVKIRTKKFLDFPAHQSIAIHRIFVTYETIRPDGSSLLIERNILCTSLSRRVSRRNN